MKRQIENILWAVAENAPTVLTIIFAAYVITLSQTISLSTDKRLEWILIILGLLAVSELIEKWRKLRRIEEYSSKTLKAVLSKFGERTRAEDFFTKRLPPLEPILQKAKDIRLCGYSLQRTIRENRYALAQRMKDGARIKIMIVNPEFLKGKHIFSEPRKRHTFISSMTAISNLKWLSEQPDSAGNIEVKLINEELRFNIIAVDPESDSGIIFIEFYPQRWLSEGRPRMELTKERDGFWYSYFKNQFDMVWNEYQLADLENSFEDLESSIKNTDL